MAQSAVSAISKGCQMLKEGKAEIDKFKKTVEGGVMDAKAIYKEVTGLWGWIQSLFSSEQAKPKPVAVPVAEQKPAAKPAKANRQPEPELTYEEYQARAVHEICEHLKVYFEAIRQLKAHCRELEEHSLTTEKVADSAIDRIEMEWQMHQLSVQLKDAMIYQTPKELGLGSMYENFLVKYDEIVEAQEFARAVKAKNKRDEEYRKWRLSQDRAEYVAAVLGTLVLVLMVGGMLWDLKMQMMARSAFWHG